MCLPWGVEVGASASEGWSKSSYSPASGWLPEDLGDGGRWCHLKMMTPTATDGTVLAGGKVVCTVTLVPRVSRVAAIWEHQRNMLQGW